MGRVALFVPCYIDQVYPQVGVATLQLLEKLGLDVIYPTNQTCCGQPLGNAGYECELDEVANWFVDQFAQFDAIISPSGSCVHFVKEHYSFIDQTSSVKYVRNNVYELCDYIVNVLKLRDLNAQFPHQVGIHYSCHRLRGLNSGMPSEVIGGNHSNIQDLLESVRDLSIIKPDRRDECCGFGGTFSMDESAVSAKMCQDRSADFEKQGAEYITSTDMSCLMHLDGILKRSKSRTQVIHVAEILNQTMVVR